MLRAVLFDLDHTLFDRHATLRAIVPQLRAAFRVDPALSDDEVARIWCYADDSYVYDGWNYIFAYLTENGVFLTPPDYGDYRSFIFRAFAGTAVPFPYTVGLLRDLRRQGFVLGLVTNGQHALQYKKLALTGLAGQFDEILVSGDMGVEKPDPDIFLAACEKLGVSPREAVYVGDNRKNDIDGAIGAGLRAVWLRSTNPAQSGKRTPTAEIDSLLELPGAIEKLRDNEQEDR